LDLGSYDRTRNRHRSGRIVQREVLRPTQEHVAPDRPVDPSSEPPSHCHPDYRSPIARALMHEERTDHHPSEHHDRLEAQQGRTQARRSLDLDTHGFMFQMQERALSLNI
jgi:hypothetical protein